MWMAFTRQFDSGDTTQDKAILPGETGVIWAIGQTFDLAYHGLSRGFVRLTLLQDGVEVATTTHLLLKEGGIAIQIGEGGVLSRIEYTILDSLSHP